MTAFLNRLRWRLGRGRREEELREELAFHLEEESERQREDGVPADKAQSAARRDLGGTLRVAEDTRESWGWLWLDRLVQDVRYAGRMMRRKPGFTGTAVLSLALGVGANTAVFSMMYALLAQTLPVQNPHELVRLVEGPRVAFTYPVHVQLRESQLLAGVIGVSGMARWEIQEGEERHDALVAMVSDDYFDMLGVRAARGRVFHAPRQGEPREPIAVISDRYWREHYGGDFAAIGRRFVRGRTEFTIAGIASSTFRGTDLDSPAEIWVSLEQVLAPDDDERVRGRWIQVWARVRTGVTPEQASAEASAIVGRPVQFESGATGHSSALRTRLRQPLLLVGVVVGLVLLVTCANLANLVLSDSAARQREIAVRQAVGASRGRLARQLLTESAFVAAISGVLAIGVARWTSSALLSFLPPAQAPAAVNLRVGLDWRVVACVSVLTLLTCLMFSLIPALRAANKQATALKIGVGAGQRHHGWMSRGLLISEALICTLLLIVGGVFLRTIANLKEQDSGYRERGLLVADVGPPGEVSEERSDELIEILRGRVANMPGVEAASFSHVGQLQGQGLEWRIGFEGQPYVATDAPIILEQRVAPGFFTAMGTRVVAGRDFNERDTAASTLVALVNESFARSFYPGRSPLGQRFFREGGSRSLEPMEIVGVVQDTKWIDLRADRPPMYYRPYTQMGGTPVVRLAIRTTGDIRGVAAALPGLARTIDRRIVLTNVVPFSEIVNRTLVTERLVAQVTTAFAALGLLIAAIGLYGVLSYAVARRRREIGVRIAIGAGPGRIEWMFLKESITLVAIGFLIGVPVAIAVTRLVSSWLFGLGPGDPATVVATLLTLTLTTIAAAYLPARRAAHLDPVRVLRED